MRYYHSNILPGVWNQLGVMLDENYNDGDDSVIVLGAYVHQPVESMRSFSGDSKLIVYQTEPLVDSHWHNKEKIISNIIGADEIWDYDLENIEILERYGINAKFRPPAYSNNLKRIQNREDPDIDVLFYGSYTEYRCKTIQDVFNGFTLNDDDADYLANCRFVWLYNISSEDLDEYISRSKIILNMRPYEAAIRQQQARIYYPLINDKCVLSERSNINYFGNNIVEYSGSEDLWNKIPNLLKNDTWKTRKSDLNGWIGNSKNSSKIAIFYHVFQFGDWRNVFEEQLVTLQQSGLYDTADYIHIGINGTEELPFQLFKVNRIKYNTNHILEADTLSDLHNFAISNPDYKILYIHSKGVSRYEVDTVVAWRRYLEYFVIKKWKSCISILDNYDCVGTEWGLSNTLGETCNYLPHYSGNFWWATANYISKLDPNYIYDDYDGRARWRSELWIGTKDPKYYNFYSSDKNKYENIIDASEYTHL